MWPFKKKEDKNYSFSFNGGGYYSPSSDDPFSPRKDGCKGKIIYPKPSKQITIKKAE
jgi:hypothetical protein